MRIYCSSKPYHSHKMRIYCFLFIVCLTGQCVNCDTGYFWHITDHHYDPTYWGDERSCNEQPVERGIYGDYWCDSPWRLVNDSIREMANLKQDVDFIIWTGDNVAHIKNQFLSLKQNVNIMGKITDVIKSQFPGVMVYPTMGNHDYFPADQFATHFSPLYNATADLWKDWIAEEEQMDNFRKAAFYTKRLSPKLRIVGLNTNLYYTANDQTPNYTDPAGQFDWLRGVLSDARKSSEKVIITGHIPPGLKVPGKVLWFRQPFNTQFLDVIQSFVDIIPAMYFGHDHADEFKLVQKSGGGPGVPMFMAPSVTPWRYKTPTEKADPHNPGIRLFTYDKLSGVAFDYTQYYLDLPASNQANQSVWKVGYTAKTAYDVDDLSAASVNNVITKMADSPVYLDRYIRFNTVLANGNDTVERCDVGCRAEFQCAFTKHYREELDSCVQLMVASSSQLRSLSSLIVCVLMIILTNV